MIIPTRGRSHKLANLLDALEIQVSTSDTPFEVILVIDGDGGGPDRDYLFSLEQIHTPHIGAGPARNLAMERSRGDAILFLNDDVIPEKGFIDAHTQALNAGSQAVLGYSPWVQPSDPTAFDGFVVHTPAIFNQQGLVDAQHYDFRHGWTLNLSVRRDVIDRLDRPFHPQLRPIYFEDIEFVYRCFGTDRRILYCQSARAAHDHRVSISDYFAREVLLGMMAVELYEANSACYNEIFPNEPAHHAAIVDQWLPLDVRDHLRLMKRFLMQARQPQDTLDPIEQAMMLYDLHLPLKRRAFRLGLCAMCASPIRWENRVGFAADVIAVDPIMNRLCSSNSAQ